MKSEIGEYTSWIESAVNQSFILLFCIILVLTNMIIQSILIIMTIMIIMAWTVIDVMASVTLQTKKKDYIILLFLLHNLFGFIN